MVVVRTVSKMRNLLGTFFVVVVMLVGILWVPSAHAQYGTCDYSEGVFDGADNCSEGPGSSGTDGSAGGSLSDTGQDWHYLLFAGLGLTLGISMLGAVVYIMKRRARQI